MKKRIVCILFLFAMLIPFSVSTGESATGEMKLVYIPDKELSVALPADYLSIGRDTQTLDPALISFGLTLETVLAEMESQNLYLCAYSPDFSRRIEVAISTEAANAVEGLDPEEVIMALYAAVEANYADIGATVIKKEIYRHDNDVFLIAIANETADSNYILMQSMTVVDGRAVSIILGSYNGEITDDDEHLMKEILNASVLKKHSRPEAADAD